MSSGIKLLGFCAATLYLAVACQPDFDALSKDYVPNSAGSGDGSSAGSGNGSSAGSGNGSSAGSGNNNGSAGGAPVPAACENKLKDANESDVDCGGSSKCPRCASGQRCSSSKDCETEVCTGGFCAEPSCSDKILNQDESAVDCGGACSPGKACEDGLACNENGDCQSEFCKDSVCVSHCESGKREADETDKDCGGSCDPCADKLRCSEGADCQGKLCFNNQCQPATCDDKVLNQDESSTDCGGVCAPAKACPLTARCNTGADCDSYVCSKDKCAADITVLPADVIDSFEDGDLDSSTPTKLDGRVGMWYVFGDAAGIGTVGSALMTRGSASQRVLHNAGSGYLTWGSGVGLDLNNSSGMQAGKLPYDASEYTAVTFWARAGKATTVTFVLPDSNTDAAGGKCNVSPSTCDHHWNKALQVTTAWQRFTVPFASLVLEGGNKSPEPTAVDAAGLVGVQFRVQAGMSYDLWIDDVAFVK